MGSGGKLCFLRKLCFAESGGRPLGGSGDETGGGGVEQTSSMSTRLVVSIDEIDSLC